MALILLSLLSILAWTLIRGGTEASIIMGGAFGRAFAQVSTFLGLDDVPADTYEGAAGNLVRVKTAEDGLEFVAPDTPGGYPRIDETTGLTNGQFLPTPEGFAGTPAVCAYPQQWGYDTTQPTKYRLAICVNGTGEPPLTEPYVAKLDQVCLNGTDCRTVPDGADGTLNVITGPGITASIDQAAEVVSLTVNAQAELFGTTTTVDIDNSTTETTTLTGTMPANTIGTSGLVQATMHGHALNNSGGSVVFTYKLKYGSAVHTCRAVTVGSSASQIGVMMTGYVQAVGTNAQRLSCTIVHGAGDNRASVPESFTITQSSDQTLSITVQLDTANANAEFHSYHGKALLVR